MLLANLTSVVLAAQAGDIFSAVCKDCNVECEGCHFGTEEVPRCVLLSDANITNAESDGGITTLERLRIDEGYWRAANDSTEVLACYNKDACDGGVTDRQDYCANGYQGPCESGDCEFLRLSRNNVWSMFNTRYKKSQLIDKDPVVHEQRDRKNTIPCYTTT